MRRAPFVVAATAAGLALVLTFRTHGNGPGAAAKRLSLTSIPGGRSAFGNGSTPNGPVEVMVTVLQGRIVAVDNIALPERQRPLLAVEPVFGARAATGDPAGPERPYRRRVRGDHDEHGVSGVSAGGPRQAAVQEMNDGRRVERHVEHVMGTAFSFVVHPGGLNRLDVRHAIGSACQWLHHVDEVFSTWKPDSVMSRLRRGEMHVDDAGDDVQTVLELCRGARAVSAGWFDPWALPGGVDPTGLVKGWATQEALSVLKSAGVAAAMINGGGDVATFGQPFPERPWVIGIQDPERPPTLHNGGDVTGSGGHLGNL